MAPTDAVSTGAILTEAIYSARWIFPVTSPPIQGGFVRIVGGRVAEVNSLDRLVGEPVVDLGDVALLPKSVNAHTHLEFSGCREVIGEPGVHLAEWIGMVIAARGIVDESQRGQSIADGLAESDRENVALIGDIATPPTRYPKTEASIVSFAEVLGLTGERSSERLAAAAEHESSLPTESLFGVSPHAPYSTPPTVVQQAVSLAAQAGAPVAMHLAESPDERTLLETGEGPFADSLRSVGVWRDGIFPYAAADPIADLIEMLAQAPRALLVHGNDFSSSDIAAIGRHRHLSVVYCPRTHAFFGYDAHPVAELMDAGVRVCLGTDSRASNPDLSVWRELQFLLRHRVDLDPVAVLRMATAGGADALLGERAAGTRGLGRILPGTPPESIGVIRTSGRDLDQVWRDFAERDLLCIRSAQRA